MAKAKAALDEATRAAESKRWLSRGERGTDGKVCPVADIT
jgi:hypothetical protein